MKERDAASAAQSPVPVCEVGGPISRGIRVKVKVQAAGRHARAHGASPELRARSRGHEAELSGVPQGMSSQPARHTPPSPLARPPTSAPSPHLPGRGQTTRRLAL